MAPAPYQPVELLLVHGGQRARRQDGPPLLEEVAWGDKGRAVVLLLEPVMGIRVGIRRGGGC